MEGRGGVTVEVGVKEGASFNICHSHVVNSICAFMSISIERVISDV